MGLSRYEKLSLIRINRWEKEKHEGIGKKILDGVSRPVDYLIQKIGREKFKFFEKAIETTVDKMLYASTYSVNSKDLIKRAREHGILIEDLSELKSVNFKLLDDCNPNGAYSPSSFPCILCCFSGYPHCNELVNLSDFHLMTF